MIKKDDKSINAIYYGKIPIVAIYHGTKLVWQIISSCFGNGYWINTKAWSNTDGWKN